MIYHTFMFNIYKGSEKPYFQNQYNQLISEYKNNPIYKKLIKNKRALMLKDVYASQYNDELYDWECSHGDIRGYRLSDTLLKIENKIKKIINNI